MNQYLTEDNIIIALVALCSLASAVLQLFGKTKASNFVGALPTTLHLGPLVAMLVEWLKKRNAAKQAARIANVALVALALSGCVGTLEDSRGRISPALGAPRNAELSKRCQTLSDRSFYYGLASTGFGATGAGAVVTSIPVDEPKWETVAVISGASAAAVSVVTGWGALKSAGMYTEEGCGK